MSSTYAKHAKEYLNNVDDVISQIQSGASTEVVCDRIAFNLRSTDTDKSKYVLETDLNRRLNYILQDLKHEQQIIEIENKINAELAANKSIVATGGSVIYGKEAMEHLKEIGIVVYLEVPFSTIEKRLSDIKGRGVVLRNGQTLYDLFVERTVLYEKYADVRVSEDGLGVEETVDLLVSKLQNLNNN